MSTAIDSSATGINFQKNAPFGSSVARFDASYDCQLLFNKSPGPGSYNTTKEIPDFSEMMSGSDIETDTLISLNELKKKLNTESSMLDTLTLREHIE